MEASILKLKCESSIALSYMKGWEIALKTYEEAFKRRK